MSTDLIRYTISVNQELFKKIEDFRFNNRFATRSQATSELIKLGLEAIDKENQQLKNKID